jgi:adenylate cyclase
MKWKVPFRCAVIVLLVFIYAMIFQRLGKLQFMEFWVYDKLLLSQPRAASSDPLVLVEMTEQDIQNPELDYPIYDNKLADLLNILAADQPAAIGLDIWRDIPVPKSGVYSNKLNEAFLSHSNIVAIFTLGGIKPPAILQSRPEQLGFNDNLVIDKRAPNETRFGETAKSRRALLSANAPSGESFDSLPLRLALIYLERRGIGLALDPADTNSVRLGKTSLPALRPNDGAYVGADNRGWQILMDFICPDKFTRFSVTDALTGKIPRGALKDKVVLIGMTAASVQDNWATPVRFDHRGVEVQAMIVHQLLRAALEGTKPLRFWNDWVEAGWALLWCLVGGAIGYWMRSPVRFTLSLSAGVVALWLIGRNAFAAGWWIPIVWPALTCLPAAALLTSYISYEERRQRGILMQMFSREVSPDIAQALWEQRDHFMEGNRPHPQKLTATVLFTDLKGFSTTSEGLDPEHLMSWLNEYMSAMAKVVMANHGVVEKYIGDSVMALFGAPLARATQEEIAEDARNAVRCASQMGKEMERLNVEWKERGLPPCTMRVGIHTGTLVAGSLGSAERQEYTVIGDSVNTASRLESFDKEGETMIIPRGDCRILVSEATQTLLGDEFRTLPIGEMNLKGKGQSVRIFCILNPKKEPSVPSKPEPELTTPS